MEKLTRKSWWGGGDKKVRRWWKEGQRVEVKTKEESRGRKRAKRVKRGY